MKQYLLCIIGLLPPTARAQQRLPSPPVPPADTLFFDRDWARTSIPEDRTYARLIRHGSDGHPTGIVRDFYYPSWKKQWEGKLLSEDPEVATGLCTFWYENGKLKARGTYSQGRPGSDYQEWQPTGALVTCKMKTFEVLPIETAELHPYLHSGGSQHVFSVNLPENTVSAIYRLDIRDIGQPMVNWNNITTLAKLSALPGPGLLQACVNAMQNEAQNLTAATKPTQCHYFVTTDIYQAKNFYLTQGKIPDGEFLHATSNTVNEVRPLANLSGARQLFICINNNNIQTRAIAKVSVTAFVKQCK